MSTRKHNKEKGRQQATALLAEVDGEWYLVDKHVKSGYSDEVPVFVGVGSGFDILRWVVWTFKGGKQEAIETVEERLKDEDLEVRIVKVCKHLIRGEKLDEITGDWKDGLYYVPQRTLYGPKLARSTKIQPK